MIIDLSIGIFFYVFVSRLLGEEFSGWMLFFSIVCAFSPDFDFIIFVMIRKRLRLVSHHFFHFPLLFLSIGGLLVGAIGGGYPATLFITAACGSFVHDSYSIVGIRWLYPFSKQAYRLVGMNIVLAHGREAYYEQLRQTRASRTLWDEFWMRISGDFNRWAFVFLFISCWCLVVFIT